MYLTIKHMNENSINLSCKLNHYYKIKDRLKDFIGFNLIIYDTFEFYVSGIRRILIENVDTVSQIPK